MEKEKDPVIQIDANLLRKVANEMMDRYEGALQLKAVSDQVGLIQKQLPKMQQELTKTRLELATDTIKLANIKSSISEATRQQGDVLKANKDEVDSQKVAIATDLKQAQADTVKVKADLRAEIVELRREREAEEELLKQARAQKEAMLKGLQAA